MNKSDLAFFKGLGCITAVIASPFIMVGSAIANAWAVVTLWTWFAIPLGLPKLAMMNAAGLMILVAYFFPPQPTGFAKDPDRTMGDSIAELIGSVVFKPLTAVSIGWLVINYWHSLPLWAQ